MAVVKNHWKLLVLQVVVITIIAGVTLVMLHRGPVQAEPPAPGTPPPAASADAPDPLTYSRVKGVCDQFALTGRDLSLIGCDKTQAKGIYQSLITWCKDNKEAIDAAELAEVTVQRELAEAMRKINVGPASAAKQVVAQLPTLKANVAGARSKKQDLLESGIVSALGGLDAAVQLKQTKLRANSGLPEPWRLIPDLTAAEVKEIRSVLGKYGGTSNQTKALYQRISVGARGLAVENAKSVATANIDGVLQAEQEVLPVPEQMRLSRIAGPPRPN